MIDPLTLSISNIVLPQLVPTYMTWYLMTGGPVSFWLCATREEKEKRQTVSHPSDRHQSKRRLQVPLPLDVSE